MKSFLDIFSESSIILLLTLPSSRSTSSFLKGLTPFLGLAFLAGLSPPSIASSVAARFLCRNSSDESTSPSLSMSLSLRSLNSLSFALSSTGSSFFFSERVQPFARYSFSLDLSITMVLPPLVIIESFFGSFI